MSDIPEGSVVITPAEIYAKVVALTTEVTKLVTQGEASAKVDTDRADKVAQLEARVRAVEAKVWLATGVCAAAGSGIGAALAQVLR